MTIFDVDIDALIGGATDLDRYSGPVPPVVNVASRRGLIPRSDTLRSLSDTYPRQGRTAPGGPDARRSSATFAVAPPDPAGARFGPWAGSEDGEPVAVVAKLSPR